MAAPGAKGSEPSDLMNKLEFGGKSEVDGGQMHI